MKRRIQLLWPLITLGLLFGLALTSALSVAQRAPNGQPSARQSQPDQQQSPNQEQQPPDQGSQAAPNQNQQTDTQTFAGTIVKNGNKFVLKNESGTTYDIDRQDLVKSYEGRRVRINGTLDADGKTIHIK